MNFSNPRNWHLWRAGLLVGVLAGSLGSAANFGRLLGTVTDTQGNPLMGVTVAIVGPTTRGLGSIVDRVITDAHGRFAIEHLAPGSYSLRITAPTRVPALRNNVSVRADRTTQQDFTLGDIFTPLRFQLPPGNVSTWGEDWKWVLRTSAATRPILRLRETRSAAPAKTSRLARGPSQRLIGLMPVGTRSEGLAETPSLGSVLAYLRPLSQDSDLLVAGSMTAGGLQASSLATAFRKNLINGEPQVISVVVHQLNFTEGFPLVPRQVRGNLTGAQGIALSYARVRRLSDSLSLTAGFHLDYLNVLSGAVMARPSMKLEYQINPSTLVAFQYGNARTENEPTLLERIGALNAFPRVTLLGYRPRLENLNHAALSVERKLSKSSRVEVSAYRDSFENAAVLGSGGSAALNELAGNFLPNPVSRGVILNGGNYRSSGLRTVYSRGLGSHLETSFQYASGSALAVDTSTSATSDPQRNLWGVLRANVSRSLAGKVSAHIPTCQTEIVTSYQWIQAGRVTSVDPYGQAALQIQPGLGIFIRQPLPALAFLPAHIEALADFRNLLAQGYTRLPSGSGEEPLLLTSGYRSFRGGFSVQF